MEDDGLVSRKAYNSKPPLRVEYELTDFGKTLIPLLEIMAAWGRKVGEDLGQLEAVQTV